MRGRKISLQKIQKTQTLLPFAFPSSTLGSFFFLSCLEQEKKIFSWLLPASGFWNINAKNGLFCSVHSAVSSFPRSHNIGWPSCLGWGKVTGSRANPGNISKPHSTTKACTTLRQNSPIHVEIAFFYFLNFVIIQWIYLLIRNDLIKNLAYLLCDSKTLSFLKF